MSSNYIYNSSNKPNPSKPAAKLLHEYTKTHIIHALIETKVFKLLNVAGESGLTIAEIVAKTDLYDRFLKSILEYMVLTKELISKKGEKYILEKGNEWLFDESLRFELLLGLGAYQPIMSNLVDSLRKQKVYGVDYTRIGNKLAEASFGVTKENYPFVVAEFKKLGVKKIADLGCGAAEVLISFCKLDPELQAIGIDIDPLALEEAQKRVDNAGLTDRIKLMQGDLRDATTWNKSIVDFGVQAFTCIGVIHEFLREGPEAVQSILKNLQKAFPGAYFMLGEFDAKSDDYYLNTPLEDMQKDLWYQHIIHPLSMQGIPISKEEWVKLCDEIGVETIHIESYFLDQFLMKL